MKTGIGASLQYLRKFGPLKNYPVYGTHHSKITHYTLICNHAFVVLPLPSPYRLLYSLKCKFDVNMYSPNGIVVFEALLIVENINDLEFGPYSINGVGFDLSTTITLNKNLDLNVTKWIIHL